jgi:hypothetical protein
LEAHLMNDDLMTSETRRDRWGRYLVVPPDGGKPVGYTRATTIAKTLDDTSSLMAWGERMTAIGLARRPDLVATIDHVAHDKDALNRICAAAKEAGGATVRRDLGTALHTILERWWTEPGYVPPAAHIKDVNAVCDALQAHGLTVVDGMHERIVVHDRHKVAGTFDLILEDAAGVRCIADIKTGSSVKFGALGFAVQLAIYATADALYTQGNAVDGSADRREPMPEVRQDQAIIIHVEPGSGICELHQLTLDPTLVDLAMTVRQARARKDLIDTLTARGGERDRWLRERLARLIDEDKARVVAAWPQHIATPSKHPHPYSDEEIDEIIPKLELVERALEFPFPDPDPGRPQPVKKQRKKPQPAATPSDSPSEGPTVDDDDLRTAYSALDDRQRAVVGEIVAEAHAANLPIRVQEMPSRRRCEIAAGIFEALCRWPDDHETNMRQLLAVVLDDDTVLMPTLPLGAAIGLLDDEQAATWRQTISLGATVEA